MEELLKQIIARLDRMEQGQQRLEERQDALAEGQLKLEQGQQVLLQGQSRLEERQETLAKGQQKLEQRQQVLESGQLKLEEGQQALQENIGNITGQLNENTALIHAMIHNLEMANAKIDGLVVNTVSKEVLENLANKEDIKRLDTKFEIINSKLFNQEVEIHQLKAVK